MSTSGQAGSPITSPPLRRTPQRAAARQPVRAAMGDAEETDPHASAAAGTSPGGGEGL